MKRLGLFLLMICCVSYIYGYTADVSPRRNVAESGTCGNMLTWTFVDSVLTISGTGLMKNWTSVTHAPWYSLNAAIKSIVISEGVTSIGDYAFYGCAGLISIQLPVSVSSIGKSALSGCSDLKSIQLPNYITSIGNTAFFDCTGLTSIIIPNSVTSIGSSAFSGCGDLVSIQLSNNITSIEARTFYGCEALTSINIPEGVTSIGEYAFSGCSSLSYIEIPNSVINIGAYAFQYCASLTSVEIPNSVTAIGERAFYDVPCVMYSGTATGSPWGAKAVNGYVEGYVVFSNTSKVQILACSCAAKGTITIPNSVTSISNWAFSTCFGITSVEIPSSVTNIGNSAFNGVSCIFYTGTATGAPWGARAVNGYVENNVIYNNANKTQLLACPATQKGGFVIPNTVTSIGKRAFYNCEDLISIEIPNSVISIDDDAFCGCSGITSIVIPNSVKSMGDWVFAGCSSLTSVELPDSVTRIGDYAFKECSNLPKLLVPQNVTSIGKYAFKDCYSLTSINIPEGVTIIDQAAFTYCKALTSINIPESVTNVSDYTFSGCSSLKSASISNSVTSIGTSAFANCTSLNSIQIPNSVRQIYGSAFINCPIKNLLIPAEVDTIGTQAFSGKELLSVLCASLTPPALDENAFDFPSYYSKTKVDSLFVPAQSVLSYVNSSWSNFFHTINEIVYGESEVNNITNTNATLSWETCDEVAQYNINIFVSNTHYAHYIVDGNGQVISSLRFSAPDIHQQKQDTTTSSTDYFVISLDNLTPGTDYTYTIEGTDATSKIVYYGDGSFSTTGYPTSIPLITTPFENKQSKPCKIFKDGQLYIIIDDKIYLLTGQEIK